MRLIDWRRSLIAAPLIIAVAAAVFLIARDDGATADTPRATLVETPPGVTPDVGVQKGELARDFTGFSPHGEPVRLSELRGRPTIINFWATWCTSCLAELPDFKALQQEVGAENLNVVAINAGEARDDALAFLDDLQADSFVVGMDPTLVVADAYNVAGLPTSIFLDADGVVRGVYAGHLRKEDMHAYLRAATEGEDAAEPAPRIRLVTTVARDHTLEVDDQGNGRAQFFSKSLRCDDSYCAAGAINEALSGRSVDVVALAVDEDPPRLSVAFDESAITLDEVTQIVVDALTMLKDPLYERPLEIRER
jgi:thiol-disulfide isomerase/thioredoxin